MNMIKSLVNQEVGKASFPAKFMKTIAVSKASHANKQQKTNENDQVFGDSAG